MKWSIEIGRAMIQKIGCSQLSTGLSDHSIEIDKLERPPISWTYRFAWNMEYHQIIPNPMPSIINLQIVRYFEGSPIFGHRHTSYGYRIIDPLYTLYICISSMAARTRIVQLLTPIISDSNARYVTSEFQAFVPGKDVWWVGYSHNEVVKCYKPKDLESFTSSFRQNHEPPLANGQDPCCLGGLESHASDWNSTQLIQ